MKMHNLGMRLGMPQRMKTSAVKLAVALGAHGRTGERVALMERQRLSVGLRRATVVALLLGVIAGASVMVAPRAHASQNGGGGCSYYWQNDSSDGNGLSIWHTNLCVDGPYYNSSGHRYYTWTASCWMTSAQQVQGGLAFGYELSCTVQDSTAPSSNNNPTWQTAYSGFYCKTCYNSQTILALNFPWYTASYLPTSVSIWPNGMSGVFEADSSDQYGWGTASKIIAPGNADGGSSQWVS